MKRIIIAAMVIIMAVFIGTAALACEMHFTVVSKDGESVELRPGKELKLGLGETYTMRVEFVEDHNNCTTPPNRTVYLLEDEKWKPEKDYLPLFLEEEGGWEEISPGTWVQKINFIAQEEGRIELEVVRDCPKGGYNETFEIRVK